MVAPISRRAPGSVEYLPDSGATSECGLELGELVTVVPAE
jgi:hypothetical protein